MNDVVDLSFDATLNYELLDIVTISVVENQQSIFNYR